jgi:YHS domain-containing protein
MAHQTKDPVCGMNVDSNHIQYKTEYQGKQYAFCCQQCLDKFKKNPEQFARERA